MSIFNGSAENIENNLNKVSSVDENSTDKQYPSAKAVYDRTKDYIVEQGEKDGWTYEKWNSGKAVVSRSIYHSFDDGELSPDGNRYITINRIRFPDNLFTKTPTIASINSNVHYIGVNYSPDSSSSEMAYIIISSGINLGLGYSVGYSIEIKGTWK